MKPWTRRAWGCLLSGALGVLAGCSDEVVQSPTIKMDTTQRQDGPDWKDTGPLAACKPAANTAAPCGTYEAFDLSACKLASLDAERLGGVYTAHVIFDGITPVAGRPASIRVVTDGGVSSFNSVAFPQTQLEDGRLFMGVQSNRPDGGSSAVVMVGCETSDDGLTLRGCYQQCRNGKQQISATFEAQRVVRREGEAEGSGMTLLSETQVGDATPADVYVTKGHAYVVSLPFLNGVGARSGGLSVFDVTNPRAPVLKKSITFANDNYWNGVWAKDDALYVASGDRGLHVFDISNPADPQLLRTLPADEKAALDVHTVIVEGDRLYAMSPSPNAETLIFDVKDAKSPVLLTRFVVPGVKPETGEQFPHDAFPFEGRLYISHWANGYVIANVDDPEEVEVAGGYFYERPTSHTSRVMRTGPKVIAFEGGEDWGAHLRILDVTEPDAVFLLGEYRLRPGISIHNMELKGNRLYLSHYQEGVRVLDVTVPTLPREVGYYNTYQPGHEKAGYTFYDGAIGIRVPGDGYVYVIDTVRGMLIFPEV